MKIKNHRVGIFHILLYHVATLVLYSFFFVRFLIVNIFCLLIICKFKIIHVFVAR